MQNFSENFNVDAIRYKGEGEFFFPYFRNDGRLMLAPLFSEEQMEVEFFGSEENPAADWMGYTLAEAQAIARKEVTNKVKQLLAS